MDSEIDPGIFFTFVQSMVMNLLLLVSFYQVHSLVNRTIVPYTNLYENQTLTYFLKNHLAVLSVNNNISLIRTVVSNCIITLSASESVRAKSSR